MLTVIAEHWVNDGQIDKKDLIFKEVSASAKKAPGFVSRFILTSQKDPTKFSTVTTWENQEALVAAMAEFDTYSCRFYVAGRLHDSAFATIRDLNVPQQFEHLFVEIPEELFRLDVSSTSIRAKKL